MEPAARPVRVDRFKTDAPPFASEVSVADPVEVIVTFWTETGRAWGEYNGERNVRTNEFGGGVGLFTLKTDAPWIGAPVVSLTTRP
jgi:hypothetical protein